MSELMTTGEISAHFQEIYGADVSRETVSRITERVVAEKDEWCSRPLDRVYAAVFIDATVVKVRDGQVANRPVYVAVGIDLEPLAPRIPQSRAALGERRRPRAVERPRLHPSLTERCRHAVGGDAQWPAALDLGDAGRRRQRRWVAAAGGQRIHHLEQQRQRSERWSCAYARRNWLTIGQSNGSRPPRPTRFR